MKKILLAFDGSHLSDTVFEFLKFMNSQQPVLAVGFFLPSVDYAELLYSFGGVPSGPMYITEAVPADPETVSVNMSKFRKLCIEHGISCIVRQDDLGHVVNTIKDETRYADLLLIDGKTFYENLGEEAHQEYVTNTLHQSECPIMIVPQYFHKPESLVFAYDGSEQSIFAIKQFYYLFPYYTQMPVYLVFFAPGDKDLPHREKIEELLHSYYDNVTITKPDIHSKDEIEGWLLTNKNPILVTGAYGRSAFSEFLRHSFVSAITNDNKLLVFVAHK